MKKSQENNIEKHEFSYEKQSEDRKQLEKILKVPGKHNVYNALAALAAARALGIADKISFEALGEFRGAWRRFEEIGRYKGALVVSDYAHNPAKIKALADALICKIKREKRQGKIILVFQPHHQKRLETLFDDFVEAFGDISKKFQVSSPRPCPPAGKLVGLGPTSYKFQGIITDVYEVAGREKSEIRNSKSKTNPKFKISNPKTLVDIINKKYPDAGVIYVSKDKLRKYLKNMFQVSPKQMLRIATGQAGFKFQVLCFAGAGNIDNFARKFLTIK